MAIADRTRRDVLKALGVGAAGALVGGRTAPVDAQATGSSPRASQLASFPLTDVRLLEGPFLEAQRRNERYLLQLEPDRLLHNFRRNAGLAPRAAIYGGWESQEPWVEIRCHGHTLGHYLSACAFTFASLGDARFKQRIDHVVGELLACQAAGGSGLISAFPDGATQLENSLNDKPFVGVPWYTMHKIFAGLRDAHVHAGSGDALTVLRGLAEWAWTACRNIPDPQLQRMLDREHGGMSEILADVSVLTREPRYLELAQRFVHGQLFMAMAEQRDVLDGLHSNTQIPKVIGYARLHELTGKLEYRRAAEYFWRIVVQSRSFATGGNGDRELFFPPSEFAQRLPSAKTMETCCTHNLLRLTRALFLRDPSAAYADYFERALYNGILASQDPDSGMVTYFQATRPGYVKLYCTPFDSFWCCTGSGIENHARYGESVYFQDGDSVYVNLFIPSVVRVEKLGLELTQETGFPREETTRLTMRAQRAKTLAVKIRHPAWCATATISVNGRRHTASRTPGSYVEVLRTWRTGDVIEVSLPMTLRTEPLPGVPDIVAVLYGPIVLAGRLGTEGLSPGADLIENERKSGEMLNLPVQVPDWIGPPDRLVAQIERSRPEPLSFRARGFADSKEFQLVPYYQIAHERYNLYWRVRPPTVA